jgi:hypothetical protein
MLLRRALIRAGFADHRLLTLTMACVACREARNRESPMSFQGWSRRSPCNGTCLVRDKGLARNPGGPSGAGADFRRREARPFKPKSQYKIVVLAEFKAAKATNSHSKSLANLPM